MSKKRIEDIFSSLEHHQSAPPPELWENISSQLDQQKRKRGLGIWWALAAGLILTAGISIVTYFNATTTSSLLPAHKITNTIIDNAGHSNKGKQSTISKPFEYTNGIESVKLKNNNKHQLANSQNTSANKHSKTSKNQIANTIVLKFNNSNFGQTAIQNKTSSPESKSVEPSQHYSGSSTTTNDSQTATTNLSTAITNFNTTELATNSIENNQLNRENSMTNHINLTKNDSIQLAELYNISTTKITDDPKEEDKLLKEKWSIDIFAGVANSQNLANDKTLGYLNESKSSNSYGVTTNYKLNKKWAISSGIKLSALGQNLSDVSYSTVASAGSISINGDFVQTQTILHPDAMQITSDILLHPGQSTTDLKVANFEQGSVAKSLRYLEVPLEISYALFEHARTSILLNSGGFVGRLISNQVILNGNKIGNNTDANKIIYGSVLSSTLQYELFKKTNLFVEPGMNYYFNPLQQQNFNQFQWLLNFGVNISF